MKKSQLLIGFTFTILLHVSIFYSGIQEYFDLKVYDYMSKAISLTQEKNSSSVVVVDIDEKSLSYLGQWPWSRLILANLIKSISEQNPTSIGMDIIFPEYDKTSPKQIASFYDKFFATKIKIEGLSQELEDNDKIFAQSLSSVKSILSVYMSDEKTNTQNCYIPKTNRELIYNAQEYVNAESMLCNIEELQQSSYSIGFINSERDTDGVFRRIPLFIKYKENLIPSFGLANLLSVDTLSLEDKLVSILGHTFHIGDNFDVLLDFKDLKQYETLSAIDILTQSVPLSKLQGKFVILGTSAVGLHDRYMISSSAVIPGVFVHATLIDNILHDRLKVQPERYKNINFFFSVFLSLFLVFLLYKNSYIKLFILFLLFGIVSHIVGFYFLYNDIYISIGYFLIPYGIHFFIINLLFIILHYKERKKFYKDLTKAHSSAIDSMALVAETRDTETGAHIKRTKEYMVLLGEYLYDNDICKEKLTKNFRDLLYRATPLHDVGKVGIPDNILKKPGKLTQEEYTIMKSHSKIGKDIIENAMKDNAENEFLKIAYNIAYYHHEKWDGNGYPCALKGEKIPLEARMMALCDVYDALISRRCYKLSFDYEDSEKIIIDGSGTHFDPTLIEAFIELKDKFKEIAERIKE
jgi:adenylate cyclase